MDFLSFKKHAFSKLKQLTEAKRESYERVVCENFGRLRDLVESVDLDNLAKMNNFDLPTTSKLKNAEYSDNKFSYFIHDNNFFIGTDNDGKILEIGNFNNSLLKGGDIYE